MTITCDRNTSRLMSTECSERYARKQPTGGQVEAMAGKCAQGTHHAGYQPVAVWGKGICPFCHNAIY